MKFLEYLLLERNIVNIENIDKVIYNLGLVKHPTTPQMKKWLETNLKNYLLREYEPTTDVTLLYKSQIKNHIKKNSPWIEKALERGDNLLQVNLTPAFIQQLYHVLDYFIASPNLRLDRISVPEAIRQSEEWTKQLNKKASGNDDLEGIKEVRKYPDGFTWVEVFSKKALDREGKLMDHCVGSYCGQVSSGRTKIYSLRDKKNEPHCTMEVVGKTIIQIKGYGNGSVDDEYRKYVIDFIEKPVEKAKFTDINDMENIGCISIKGKLYTKDDSEKPIVKKYLIDGIILTIDIEFRDWKYATYGERKWIEMVFDHLYDQDFPYDFDYFFSNELKIDKNKELRKYFNNMLGKTLFGLFNNTEMMDQL